MNIVVIPARGGSKRIPRKNIRRFHGQPMLAYPIQTAQRSGCCQRVIVSTDDPEIATIAREYGAETPFMRPAELSDDYTGTGAIMRHALQWLDAHDHSPDYVCCLYATTPLLRAATLRRGLLALQAAPDKAYAFTVTAFDFPIQRGLRIHAEGHVEPLWPEHIPKRSQDLEPCYHDAGQFYWARPQAYRDKLPMFSRHALPIILPRHEVVDIDTEDDWLIAERLYSQE